MVPFLLRQVASPVRWTACVSGSPPRAPTAFVEVGPGRVLTGLSSASSTTRARPPVEDPAGLDKALAALAAAVTPRTLDGKVAIVTGGSRGIGIAIAPALLAEHGAAVVVSGRDARPAGAAVHELESRGAPVHGVAADAAKREDADRLVRRPRSASGGSTSW